MLRTSVPKETLDTAAVVLAYKSLSQVEHAFRSLKTVDLEVRPIHHRLAERVRAHVFLCMLAYYVTWHMHQALAPMLFEDHDKESAAKARSSPVAPPPRRQGQGRLAQDRRRPARAQLPHAAAGPRHAHPQHCALRRCPARHHAR